MVSVKRCFLLCCFFGVLFKCVIGKPPHKKSVKGQPVQKKSTAKTVVLRKKKEYQNLNPEKDIHDDDDNYYDIDDDDDASSLTHSELGYYLEVTELFDNTPGCLPEVPELSDNTLGEEKNFDRHCKWEFSRDFNLLVKEIVAKHKKNKDILFFQKLDIMSVIDSPSPSQITFRLKKIFNHGYPFLPELKFRCSGNKINPFEAFNSLYPILNFKLETFHKRMPIKLQVLIGLTGIVKLRLEKRNVCPAEYIIFNAPAIFRNILNIRNPDIDAVDCTRTIDGRDDLFLSKQYKTLLHCSVGVPNSRNVTVVTASLHMLYLDCASPEDVEAALGFASCNKTRDYYPTPDDSSEN